MATGSYSMGICTLTMINIFTRGKQINVHLYFINFKILDKQPFYCFPGETQSLLCHLSVTKIWNSHKISNFQVVVGGIGTDLLENSQSKIVKIKDMSHHVTTQVCRCALPLNSPRPPSNNTINNFPIVLQSMEGCIIWR